MAALGVLATYPVLESGFCDDFSYAKTSLDLLRTGHLIYNGWATAMLGWQVYWGALIIKLFGFSFLALHLSTIPFAMGCGALLFSICQRLGLNNRNSILCTLTLVLCPVFVPLAASFMTDVPALFWIFVCLYCCIRAVTANEVGSSIRWLTLCTFVSLVCGTGRQTVWLGALVMVPSAAWLLRPQKGILKIAAAFWIFSFAVVVLFVAWFQHQPYSVPENLAGDQWRPRMPLTLGHNMTSFVLTVLLFSLPALVCYLPSLKAVHTKRLLPLFGILVIILYLGLGRGWNLFAPWMMGMVMSTGIDGDYDMPGLKPLVLNTSFRVIVTVFLVTVLYGFVNFLVVHLRSTSSNATPHGSLLSWRSLLWLLGPFALVYLGLMIPRAAATGVLGLTTFDRYTLPLIPVVMIIVLRFYQEHNQSGVPVFAFLTLAAFSVFGIASTHDYFAMQRAVLKAASSLTDSGISRRAIQANFEYDGWTEMQTTGHLNDPRILVPKGVYHKTTSKVPNDCWFWFADRTPSVDPKYFVTSSVMPCLAPPTLPPVGFRSWLPPFQGRLFIQTLRPQMDSR